MTGKPIDEAVERARQCIVMLRQHLALFVQDDVAQAMSRDADEAVAALTAVQQQVAASLPTVTRVHLIGGTAFVIGTPEKGWDEEAPGAHNCDAMGCPTIGPHVLARVPFTDEREKQKT